MVESLSHDQPISLPPLTLLVHPSIAPLSDALRRLHELRGWPILSVGPRVADAIVELHPRQRPMAAEAALEGAIAGMGSPCILLDQIDLLFEPSLELDPLLLLTRLGRRARLVVAWPGNYSEETLAASPCTAGVSPALQRTLAYAVPQHAHYRTWQDPPASIIALSDIP